MAHSPRVMDRRAFLRNATIATLGLTAVGSGQLAASASPAGKRPVPRGKISIQLYSLRSITRSASDRSMVFETLREFGYRKVEPYTNYGLSWSELGDTLRSYDLEPTSLHNGDRDPERATQASVDLGSKYTNMNFARMNTLDEWRAFAVDVLNPVHEAMTAAGVKYGYHNHDAEFTVEENGVQAYDVLLEEFNGHMQLDLYWAVTGGADPVEVFSRDEGRFLQFHVKDKAADGFFADPGEGTIDFPRIFAARKESGVQEYITENDSPADALEFAETGFDYLRNLRY